MYAITFDLDINCLNEQYPEEKYNNAYKYVKKFLLENGFEHVQGSVYFGNENINAVSCVTVIQNLAREYTWFANCVKDIRMLKIEENNDLRPAINNI